MSPQSSKGKKKKSSGSSGVQPVLDVYVGLLLLSVGALITGVLFLKFQLDVYL